MNDFWSAVASQERTEADIAVATAVYLQRISGEAPALAEVVDAIEENGVRNSVNRSRLKTSLSKFKHVSISSAGKVLVRLSERNAIGEAYKNVNDFPVYEVRDTLLEKRDFEACRPYIKGLVQQINAARQQELFDACAVMMRRLMEILLIEAIEASTIELPLDLSGNPVPLSDLVGIATSGRAFKLSRVSKPTVNKIKALGDTAAHHRRYLTKRSDIDDSAHGFRVLISELVELLN